MQTSAILTGLLIIISQASFANQPEDGKRPDLTALATQLQLDEGKAKQLKIIMKSHHEKMKQLHQKKAAESH